MTTTERARAVIVGVVAPLIIALVGVVAILVALPSLPDPIAVHWGVSGQPDRFGSPWLSLVLLVVVVGGYSAFAFVVTRGDEPFTANQRAILAIGWFLAVVMTVTVAGTMLIQVGLEDAAAGASVGPLVIGAIVGGLAAAVAAWFLLPASHAPAPLDPADAPVLELGATERAVWMQRIGPAPTIGALVAAVLPLAIIGGGIAIWTTSPLPAFVLYIIVMLVVTVLVAGTLFWRVRVDEAGLLVASALGVPRFRVPIAEVETAGVVEVDPAREFGGWGIRWGGARRLGVIMRRGEAIEVRRTDGRALVVTVDGAPRAAALLNALVARSGRRIP